MLVAISKSLQLVNAEWRGQFPCVSTCDADHCKHGDNGDDDADLGDGDHDGDDVIDDHGHGDDGDGECRVKGTASLCRHWTY